MCEYKHSCNPLAGLCVIRGTRRHTLIYAHQPECRTTDATDLKVDSFQMSIPYYAMYYDPRGQTKFIMKPDINISLKDFPSVDMAGSGTILDIFESYVARLQKSNDGSSLFDVDRIDRRIWNERDKNDQGLCLPPYGYCVLRPEADNQVARNEYTFSHRVPTGVGSYVCRNIIQSVCTLRGGGTDTGTKFEFQNQAIGPRLAALEKYIGSSSQRSVGERELFRIASE